jgi:hypothetical protein
MPRDGSIILTDVREPTLTIVCEPCGRRGRYSVAKLMAEHGDAKLTDLLEALAACPKARSASVHDRCKAVYGQRLP